jgi:hypothetical protein
LPGNQLSLGEISTTKCFEAAIKRFWLINVTNHLWLPGEKPYSTGSGEGPFLLPLANLLFVLLVNSGVSTERLGGSGYSVNRKATLVIGILFTEFLDCRFKIVDCRIL